MVVLIIVFIAFGFYAILKFIDLQKTIQIQSFLTDFQNNVNDMWKSPGGSTAYTYSLPTEITSVCFSDDPNENLKFTSNKIIHGKEIDNLNIANITAVENPYCIDNVNGKVSLTLAKDFGETLVKVIR